MDEWDDPEEADGDRKASDKHKTVV